MGLGAIALSSYTPAMPIIAADLGIALPAVETTFSLYLIGIALGQLAFGPLSDRYGRRPMLFCGLIVFVLASALCFLASTVSVLGLGRFLLGIGASAAAVMARTIVRDLYTPKEAAQKFSVIQTVLGAAPAFGPLIGGMILTYSDWHGIFVLLILLAGGLWALSLRLPETRPPGHVSGPLLVGFIRGSRTVLRNRSFLLFLIMGTGNIAAVFGFHTVAPGYFITRLGVSPIEYGGLLLISVVGFMGGSILGNIVIGRAGLGPALVGGLCCNAVSGVALFLLVWSRADGPLSIMLLYLVWAFGCGLSLPAATAMAVAPFSHLAGTASAVMGFAQMAGGAVCGVVASILGQGGLLPLMSLFALLGLVSVAALVPCRHMLAGLGD